MKNVFENLFEYSNQNGTFHISCREKTGHYSMPDTHFHDHPEIYYLLSGERYYFINDRTYHVKKGDLVLINSHELHRTQDASVSAHKRILVYFKPAFITSADQSDIRLITSLFNACSPVIHLSFQDQVYCENIFSQIIEEIKNTSEWRETLIRALMLQLLVFIGRCRNTDTVSEYEHPSPLHKKVSEIVDYININYSKDISLDILSKYFYMSSTYLSKVFKKTTGFNFIEYLNSVRIKAARSMLSETNRKVTDIAERSGFKSISHFGRVFRSSTGTSPKAYRKSVANND